MSTYTPCNCPICGHGKQDRLLMSNDVLIKRLREINKRKNSPKLNVFGKPLGSCCVDAVRETKYDDVLSAPINTEIFNKRMESLQDKPTVNESSPWPYANKADVMLTSNVFLKKRLEDSQSKLITPQ
jgi:hypothetical protein